MTGLARTPVSMPSRNSCRPSAALGDISVHTSTEQLHRGKHSRGGVINSRQCSRTAVRWYGSQLGPVLGLATQICPSRCRRQRERQKPPGVWDPAAWCVAVRVTTEHSANYIPRSGRLNSSSGSESHSANRLSTSVWCLSLAKPLFAMRTLDSVLPRLDTSHRVLTQHPRAVMNATTHQVRGAGPGVFIEVSRTHTD